MGAVGVEQTAVADCPRGRTVAFYLQRTPGYGKDSLIGKILGVADVQRVDMGIALCHFELTMRELGLPGGWIIREPALAKPDRHTEYVASWAGA